MMENHTAPNSLWRIS